MVGEKDEVILESNLSNLNEIAYEVISNLNSLSLCLLKGDLGSGKTTLVNKILREMKVIDITSSPTFSIINEYRLSSGEPVFHIDLYRMNSIEEVMDLGLTEYIDSGNLCLIEWPEIMDDYLDGPRLEINIQPIDRELRKYHLIKHV